MGILRTVAIAAAATTTALSLSSKTYPTTFASLSSNLVPRHDRSGLSRSFSPPPSAVKMETSHHKLASQNASLMPELLTEYMVDMKCEGCVNSVKNKLQTIEGVKNVEVDLSNQVVRILGISPVKTMTEALEQTGRKARLIGQGVPEDFLVSAAVAEFKGPEIFGVARLAQVNMELARIEASFSGLPPGKHSWSINEYGDLSKGPESTGKVFNPTTDLTNTKIV